MAQAGHALLDLAMMYRTTLTEWHEQSNNLVILTVPDEFALADLAAKAFETRTNHVLVREPDLGNELTAIALAPQPSAQKLTANMPLAGREYMPAARIQRIMTEEAVIMERLATEWQKGDPIPH